MKADLEDEQQKNKILFLSLALFIVITLVMIVLVSRGQSADTNHPGSPCSICHTLHPVSSSNLCYICHNGSVDTAPGIVGYYDGTDKHGAGTGTWLGGGTLTSPYYRNYPPMPCETCHSGPHVDYSNPYLLKNVVNGKQQVSTSSYIDINGYLYIMTRARHDGMAPLLTSGPSVINLAYNGATISWSTNENATTWVDWGLTTAYGNTVGNGSYETAHNVNLSFGNHNTYHYRLTSSDALGNSMVTSDYSFNVDFPPSVPILIDKPDWAGASDPLTVTLNWNAATDPDGGPLEYQVIIDDDLNFGSPNYDSGWISGTSWSVAVARGYYYYWKVRARDGAHSTAVSNWSTTDVFYVLSAAPPSPPTIIEPHSANLSTVQPNIPVWFYWSTVTAPDGHSCDYLLQASQSPDFSTSYGTSGWISGDNCTLWMDSGATYYCRLKARDAVHTDAESVWTTFSFYIDYMKVTSCPLVYVWTGSNYKYLTDVEGGVLGLPPELAGSKSAGLYKETYINLNLLKPDSGGNYRVKLREAQAEAAYVDELKLLVVDHPIGTSVYDATAMNTYPYGYRTVPKLYTVKNPRTPLKAWDKADKNILALVKEVDNRPAPVGQHDTDYYVFDFGPIKDTANAKLIIDGWMAAGFEAATGDQAPVQPYIELVDALGNWQKVKSIGIPSGDLKTMVVELGGLFMSSTDHRIKLCTGLMKAGKFVVDQVRLDESAPVEVKTQLLAASLADLHHGGRPTMTLGDLQQRGQARDNILPDNPQAYFYGAFTRYGEVTELINQTDDKFAIMRHGDELTLTFPKTAPPPKGYQRTYLLMADLYYKVGTHEVEPLPFHGMSDYPYPEGESYPQDAEHQEYLRKYNTRIYMRPVNLISRLSETGNPPSDYLRKTLSVMEALGGGLEGSLTLAAVDFSPRHYSLNTDYVEVKAYTSSMSSNTYNITSAGAEVWENSSMPSILAPGIVASSEQKASLTTDDNNYWTTNLVSANDAYNYQMYRFQVTQPLSSLAQLDITWKGYGEPTPGFYLEINIWNFATNSWESLSSIYAPNKVTSATRRYLTGIDRAGRGAEQLCTACHEGNYHQKCMDCHKNGVDYAAPPNVCFWCHDHNGIKNFVNPYLYFHTPGWVYPDDCKHCHDKWYSGYSPSLVNDYTPPALTAGPTVIDITATTATITWSTDEASDSYVSYGTGLNYGSKVGTSSLVTDHSVALTGLSPGTTYHFQVRSADRVYNEIASGDFTFSTF